MFSYIKTKLIKSKIGTKDKKWFKNRITKHVKIELLDFLFWDCYRNAALSKLYLTLIVSRIEIDMLILTCINNY